MANSDNPVNEQSLINNNCRVMSKVDKVVFAGQPQCDNEDMLVNHPLRSTCLTVNRVGKVKAEFTASRHNIHVSREAVTAAE